MKKYPIGFTTTSDNEVTVPNSNDIIATQNNTARKSVVRVYFPVRNMTLSYYNDMFDLHKGDIVYVDGKLEGLQGRIVDITYSFKIKLSPSFFHLTLNGNNSTDFILNSRELSYIISLYIVYCSE